MESEFNIAPYRSGAEVAISELMRVGSSSPLETSDLLRTWRWRFEDGPVEEICIDLAWHGERLAGQYAVLPVRVLRDGEERLWGLSLDTVTHPDFRRRGVFRALTEHLYDRIRPRVEVVFGFPGARASYFGMYQKLGWTRIEPHPKLVRVGAVPQRITRGRPPLRALAAGVDRLAAHAQDIHAAISSQILSDRRVVVEVSGSIPEDADALWDRMSRGAGIRVVTDERYLRWRYERHPLHRYRFVTMRRSGDLSGLAVIRPPQAGETGSFGHLLEVLVDPSCRTQAVASLVANSIRTLQAMDGRTIWVFAPVGGLLRAVLRGFGFLSLRGRGGDWPWTLGARVLGEGVSPDAVLDASVWHVGYGVSDMI